jgi:hypothetical protein
VFGETTERDTHDTAFAELAVRGTRGRQVWVAGLAFERDAYTPVDMPRFEYAHDVPAACVQYDLEIARGLSLSSSGRVDVHSEYGTFFSPCLSALARAGGWSSRLSIGTGFVAPTPITEETEAAGLTLTPRHSAGVVGMWEKEDVERVGIEWYYSGRQALEENPFRAASEPYVIVGLLAERHFGRVRLFVNGENLTGVRQTKWDPLLLPARGADGRWTVDAWAPLDGRNINGGLRLRF